MRKSLTDKGVLALKPRASRFAYPDPELRGHYVRVQPTGAKAFVAVSLDPHGKQVWATIGGCDVLTIDEAREKARRAIKRIRDGLPAFDAPAKKSATFGSITEQWLQRHVQAKGLRSESVIRGLLRLHIFPAWGDREFLGIRRIDVAELLDEVEDDHGARQADYVLAIVRGIMSWYATRNDNYSPPVIKGMRRTSPKERARVRILDDDELRALWTVAEANGQFGAFIRILLLTAQRRAKVAAMRWDHIQGGTWAIPAAPREKSNAGDLALPAAAVDLITSQPRLGENPYVFAGRGNEPIKAFSAKKADFESKLPEMPQWQLHDLRRTARSLMARAGVRPDVAERVMGHAIIGVEGIYDRHSYRDEKADALQRLATLIDGIVHPRENVIAMPKRKKSR
jgi:integrase